ncbi:MAG: hypothetical protein E6G80_03905 [Alphaproteobacteria bacterium]|nr:MAG: hypothetical protein E6G80_03905 [Alphaproteobacteria bacterium]
MPKPIPTSSTSRHRRSAPRPSSQRPIGARKRSVGGRRDSAEQVVEKAAGTRGGVLSILRSAIVLAERHQDAAALGLALTGRTRWNDLPDIPTMLEAGYPDFVFETYTALMAPAKTPPEIVARLEQVVLEILRRPEIRERLTQSGFEVTAKSGKEHMARVAREVPMFADIIARADIKKL